MLIALFGGTSSGKTTLARAWAARTGLDTRCCGDIVRAAAQRLELSLDALPLSEHTTIDAETLNWCANRAAGIVEGRFLDQVLSPLTNPICLVKIEANVSLRAERCANRFERAQNADDVVSYDEADEAFRGRAYDQQSRLNPNFILDTSNRSVDECLERLAAWQS